VTVPGAPYLPAAEHEFGRALSLLDMEPGSGSRGSFDRTWWGWKFTDFSASRLQEGAFTLAWLLTSPLAPPRFRDHPRLIDALTDAALFWTRLQHDDGSFDEAYPFERSLAATAFGTFYVGLAIERAGTRLPTDARESVQRALAKAGRWLAANGEYHGVLSNHLAAAAAALQIACDVTGDRSFLAARDRYLDIIRAHADPEEGWMREYGGADPGYQSCGLFYLAEIWRRTKDPQLLDDLKRSCGFLAWFAHPDGTMGGEYASRGTKFAWPAGFEILAQVCDDAAAVAAHLRTCAASRRGIGPSVADTWNYFPLLNNALIAAEAASVLADAPALPWQPNAVRRLFPRAGLLVHRHDDRLVAVGLNLGGALKVWRLPGGQLNYEDCGYNVGQATTQSDSKWHQVDPATFQVDAPLARLPDLRMAPWRFLAFRAFMLTIGRFPTVARSIKALLVKVLIGRRPLENGRLSRRITFLPDQSILIEDELFGIAQAPTAVARQVPVHMGSARYADAENWLVSCPTPKTPMGDGSGQWRRSTLIGTGATS